MGAPYGLQRNRGQALRAGLGGRLGRGRLPQPIDLLDYQKHAQGDDQEIENTVDENAVPEACLLAQRNRELGEIHLAQQHSDRRHHHVVHQRADDLAEGPADDDAHGHIHGIAFDGEVPDFCEQAHVHPPKLRCGICQNRRIIGTPKGSDKQPSNGPGRHATAGLSSSAENTALGVEIGALVQEPRPADLSMRFGKQPQGENRGARGLEIAVDRHRLTGRRRRPAQVHLQRQFDAARRAAL